MQCRIELPLPFSPNTVGPNSPAGSIGAAVVRNALLHVADLGREKCPPSVKWERARNFLSVQTLRHLLVHNGKHDARVIGLRGAGSISLCRVGNKRKTQHEVRTNVRGYPSLFDHLHPIPHGECPARVWRAPGYPSGSPTKFEAARERVNWCRAFFQPSAPLSDFSPPGRGRCSQKPRFVL